jgi:hypothetical protein
MLLGPGICRNRTEKPQRKWHRMAAESTPKFFWGVRASGKGVTFFTALSTIFVSAIASGSPLAYGVSRMDIY